MYIRVSKSFSDNPSEKSGSALYDNILKPAFLKIKNKESLGFVYIDLDGGFGYSTKFIRECFECFRNDFDMNFVRETIKIFSKEDPMLIDQIVGILNYVNN